MRRTGVLLVAIALGVAGLTGCSGGDDKYCSVLKDGNATSGAGLGENDPKAIKNALAEMKKAEEAAPSDVKDDWKAVNEAMEMITKDPANLDPAKLEKSGKEMETALKAIEKDTKDRCGLDMNLDG